jgi:hypothetical protein
VVVAAPAILAEPIPVLSDYALIAAAALLALFGAAALRRRAATRVR